MLQAMFGWVKPLVSGARRSRVTLYSMAPESSYAGIMREAMEAFPDVGVGSYPMSEGEYRVRVVFRGRDFDRTAASAARFEERLAEVGFHVLRRVEERGDDV
jgi:hypothetical protein